MRANEEMFASVLMELGRMATQPCYLDGVDREELSQNLIKAIQPIFNHLETRTVKFLLSNQVKFVDFMLIEVCERI